MGSTILTRAGRRRGTYVAVEVDIFPVPASGNADVVRQTIIEAIDASERIDVDQEIGKGFIGARLEGRGIATSIGIKGVNARKDGIRVNPGASTTGVGGHVGLIGVPVRLRESI
jgi:hypothetical protein